LRRQPFATSKARRQGWGRFGEGSSAGAQHLRGESQDRRRTCRNVCGVGRETINCRRNVAGLVVRIEAFSALRAANVGARRRISRTRTPANSSTAAQSRPPSARGIRQTQGHGYAWYTCHSRCSSEFIKDFEIGFLKDVRWLRRAQAPERKPSNAWARKMPALIRPKNAVTVSIIAKILCAPAGRERHAASHSQRNFRSESKIGPD
jgi:hypothetical protein